MCGIVGIFDTRGEREIDRQLLSRMNETQHHRGPDEGGLHTERGVGLGHRRLSIIDVSTGQQPLFNEDNSVAIVFNGEIYNFHELMDELLALGHVFRTRSDTEVIVHAWEQWGETCVQRFRGMFAFALWDRNRKTLFLARDRLGIKPLYYALLPDGTFIFGSELKSLKAFPQLPREIDPCAVEDYFAYGYVPEPRTIYRHAFKLPPGHTLTMKAGDACATPKRYWDLAFKVAATAAQASVEEELIEQLRDAVNSHLVAEVPLGAFLSGGVDSAGVVATMAGLMNDSINTCSIAFNNPGYDESVFAAQVAQRYATRHHTETVDADDVSLIDKLAGLYDEPYADSSAIPTYRVCQLAKKRVTVALSGDGGDEIFAGYRRYRYAMAEQRVRSMMPLAIRKPLFGTLGKVYPKADWAPRMFRAKTTFEALARDLVEGYFHGVSIMPDRVRDQLFSDRFRQQLQGYRAIEVMRAHAAQSPTDDPLSMVQYLDFKTYLPGDILTKVDRASMAHSLEVRVPLLDHKFVEWASGVPSSLKLNGGQGKYIFKKSLQPHLSDDILYRPKMGFSVPLADWFRGPLRDKVRKAVLNPVLLDTGIFNETYLRHMLDQHEAGVKDYSTPLWSVLMFESFLRVDGAGN
ncbi:amidotransferase 1, exosortase A system-associated [Noviherbaspirillum cavernae]|uniref:asparagine synthase (glutamine-hydrolyzing) n=1 Tax=Noviherbaspirillum cavernae TaxID=2320862 RepID=A0A418X3P4_9BURK|nr:XrtA/PEP-CTERM system amidotransferase [Noviherbaspirillum cavernae]RJG07045.1 amidotransferase 1, exosortase A system-associated [Noviherbaspirillum cavernae]